MLRRLGRGRFGIRSLVDLVEGGWHDRSHAIVVPACLDAIRTTALVGAAAILAVCRAARAPEPAVPGACRLPRCSQLRKAVNSPCDTYL
jgi:hypothetical protein